MAGSSWMKASFPQAVLGGHPRVALRGRGTSGRRRCWEGRGRETACGTPHPTLAHRRAHPRLPGRPWPASGAQHQDEAEGPSSWVSAMLKQLPKKTSVHLQRLHARAEMRKGGGGCSCFPHGIPCAKETSPGGPHGSS